LKDDGLVQQWLKKEYPRIKALAAREKADIYFGDACAHLLRSSRGPHLEQKGKDANCSHYRPATWYEHDFRDYLARTPAVHDRRRRSVNADAFIEFIKRLLVGAKRKIFLIVDGGPAHRAKRTKTFVESPQGRLRLFFLPPYSPDRNPDEVVWKHVKADTVGRMVVTSKGDLVQKVRSSLHSLQKLPSKIGAFFQKETLRYAA
jgi:transposase